MLFAAMLMVGAMAAPRKVLETSDATAATGAEEHQRILAELEEVSTLRERMLQEGKNFKTKPVCGRMSETPSWHNCTTAHISVLLIASALWKLRVHTCFPSQFLSVVRYAGSEHNAWCCSGILHS